MEHEGTWTAKPTVDVARTFYAAAPTPAAAFDALAERYRELADDLEGEANRYRKLADQIDDGGELHLEPRAVATSEGEP